MKIHKEGTRIIWTTAVILLALLILSFYFFPWYVTLILALFLVPGIAFVIRFFREPRRDIPHDDTVVYAPADGTIVVVEETEETEFLHEKRIQVSVFMSIWNVHINWFPVGGRVAYYKYHPGKYLVAWHPKSSELNERTTTVVDTGKEKILFRQIAGMVARRIVSYAQEGKTVEQNQQCGFIKFGSRVDVFLPIDSKVEVKVGDKVTGTQTILARLKR